MALCQQKGSSHQGVQGAHGRQNIMNLHYVPDKDLLHDILTRREIKPIDFENKESTDPKCRFTSTAFITWQKPPIHNWFVLKVGCFG
mmetsp:Transcript_42902/g.135375  ORF Transcript_42902/g.135375 Transcript_42902/m.135375 type:complete len:87 (+) Transcript_42902:498-758(+)